VKGPVQVLIAKSGQTVAAKIGFKVFPKDSLITGADGRAKVVMVDSNEINVSPNSKVIIESYVAQAAGSTPNVSLNVLYGKIRNKVNQKYDGESSRFQVKTPTAVAGVRGTDFFTAYNPSTQSTQVVTFQGAVQFGQLGAGGKIMNAVTVNPGQTTSLVAGGSPTPPKTVPPQELKQLQASSEAEAHSGPQKETRDPAGEGKDSKESGDKDKKDGKSEGAKNGANGETGGAAKGDVSRAPASEGASAPKFFDAAQDGGGCATCAPPLLSGPAFTPPPPPPPILAPPCDFCRTVIQDGTRSLLIRVKQGTGQG
jgi:hypothetical protein